jgi:hypothetical protein
MKKIFFTIIVVAAALTGKAQDFKKQVATAKSSYNSGKLEETHFALQTMLQELDVTIGKEVIKLLPAKMDTMKLNLKEDRVAANIGYLGTTTHRSYGVGARKAELEIVSNSPMLSALNAFLTSSFLTNAAGDPNTKVIKIQGYKSRLTKEENEEEGNGYKVEIPLSNALITFRAAKSTEAETMAMVNTLPLDQIAKLIQ